MFTANTKPTKKMIPMLILEILREFTDADHTFSQKDIHDVLKREYELDIDRKSIKRNIDNLIELGCGIRYSETIRMTPNSKTGEIEENAMISDIWLECDFEDSELRLLIDAMLFSNHIPNRQRKELIEKIAGLSNQYFHSHVKHIATSAEYLPQSPQLFLTIEILDEAINKKRKVKFHYMEYGIDKKLHARKQKNGEIREYIVSPYQMAASEGKYFLICNYDEYDDISNYRIDRIADVEILDERIKPFKDLKGSGKAELDLTKYMEEHFYMYSGDNARIKLRIVNNFLSDIIDVFGMNVELKKDDDKHLIVTLRANENAMFQFAKGWGPEVIVLEPKKLVRRLHEETSKIAKIYSDLSD